MKYRVILLVVAILIVLSLLGCSTSQANEENQLESPATDVNLDDEQMNELIEKSNTYEQPYVFDDENELINSAQSKFQNVTTFKELKEFYRPKSTAADISLDCIMVKDSYVALRYEYNNAEKSTDDSDEYFLIEWYRTLKEGELEENIYRIYSPELVETFKHYYIINADPVQDIFWEQNGQVFHAVTPSSISSEQLEQFCNAEKVMIE